MAAQGGTGGPDTGPERPVSPRGPRMDGGGRISQPPPFGGGRGLEYRTWARRFTDYLTLKEIEGKLKDTDHGYKLRLLRMAMQYESAADAWLQRRETKEKIQQLTIPAQAAQEGRAATQGVSEYEATWQALKEEFGMPAAQEVVEFYSMRMLPGETPLQFGHRLTARFQVLSEAELVPLGEAAKTYLHALPVHLQRAAETFLNLNPMDTTPLSRLVEHVDKLYIGMSSQAVHGMGGMRAAASRAPPMVGPRDADARRARLQPTVRAALLTDAAGPSAPREDGARSIGMAPVPPPRGKQCTHCGKHGHTQEDCWTLHPELRPARNPRRDPQGRQRPWERSGAAYPPPATLVAQDMERENERLQRELQEAQQTIAALSMAASSENDKRVRFQDECAMVAAELPHSYLVKPPVLLRQLQEGRGNAGAPTAPKQRPDLNPEATSEKTGQVHRKLLSLAGELTRLAGSMLPEAAPQQPGPADGPAPSTLPCTLRSKGGKQARRRVWRARVSRWQRCASTTAQAASWCILTSRAPRTSDCRSAVMASS